MEYELKEKDWKTFRKKVPEWQENYMHNLTQEYIQILQQDQPSSYNFWELEKRINQDKRSVGVFIEMSRSKMIMNIFSLIDDKVIGLQDLSEFSIELQEYIECRL